MRRIKLEKEIVDAFKKSAELQASILAQQQLWMQREIELWKALKNRFDGLNHRGASVEHETGELVLPFEEADDKETNKT